MIRLFVLVEGQTEEAFARSVLAPHLHAHDVYVFATIVGTPKRRTSAPLVKGGGDWPRWERDLRRILKQQHQGDVRLTTLFDLYGLPVQFPGLAEHGGDPDTNRRCDHLQASLAEAVGDPRLIPYVQRHEFEALVLATLPALRAQFDVPAALAGVDRLQVQMAGQGPEDVNDGSKTAPSKRLLASVPGYRKVLHGPQSIADTGLARVRDLCPRFDEWIRQLEGLSGTGPA